jgi:prepilin-type N-terminal cleavage/methylation domain-containing protein/prepilin-type processing-associated H-X9-DG protein
MDARDRISQRNAISEIAWNDGVRDCFVFACSGPEAMKKRWSGVGRNCWRSSAINNFARTQCSIGFTLIELLTTIAIIGILASLLLSSLARSKGVAKREYCKNNLHQIAMALELYGQDFDRYPPGTALVKGKPTTQVALWNALILPYVQTNLDVFFCPAFPSSYRWSRRVSSVGYSFPTNIQGNRPFCYAINELGLATLGSLGLDENYLLGRKPSDVRAPSGMIAVGDDTVFTNKVGGWGMFTFSFEFGAPKWFTLIGRVHSAGGNMAFIDTHVDWGLPEKWLGPTEAAARRWNYDDQPHHEFWAP